MGVTSRRFGPAFFARILIGGLATSALLAAVMTGLDWRKNPGGIFHGPDGTHWTIVGETFFSWFWPALPAMVLLILLSLVLHQYVRQTRR